MPELLEINYLKGFLFLLKALLKKKMAGAIGAGC
jgi:hypothetical protein